MDNSDGRSGNRINRFLLFEGLISKWMIMAQATGNRDISNHRPMWIKASNLNWGPKPFKVKNCWDGHEEFLDFVKKE